MMNIVLFDELAIRTSLLPFTFTRPVAGIRVGILAIAEKWEKWMNSAVSYKTEDYLSTKYPQVAGTNNLFINGGVCPNTILTNAINALAIGEVLMKGEEVLAFRTTSNEIPKLDTLKNAQFKEDVTIVHNPWDIYKYNAAQIEIDFDLITKGRKSQKITDSHTIIYGDQNVFIEEGAIIRAAIINAEDGPVYIGKNAHVHEGAIIKGAFALCEGSHVNMGAKIKGDTTIGPYSKVGGEVSNSVIFGYTNKGHDGFLGNSVIGEWCNLGADTNTSNLKNNYGDVKVWNYQKESFANTEMMFCGLMMADHAKCGINTMFNTGTVVGVAANVFGAGYPRNFIPSFSWGGTAGFTTFQMRKVFEVAEKVMERRGFILDEDEKAIIEQVYKDTAQYRVWENKDN